MSHLTPLKPRIVIKILKSLGFKKIRQRGSHIYFQHPDGRATVIPFHKGEDIGKGLISEILKDIELSWEEFISHK